MTDIVILGSGAMGTLFAARLSTQNNVTLVGSWSQQLGSIDESSLTLSDTSGKQATYRFPVQEYNQAKGTYQLALILVKGWQTKRAVNMARKLLAPDGVVLTLQNGLGHFETLVEIVGEYHAAMGVTSEGAMIVKPGFTQHTGIGVTSLGATPITEERLRKVTSLFREAGFATQLVEDLDALVWGKLVVNSGINPLTALLQVRNGFLVENAVARNIMCLAAEETAAVAESQGIQLPYSSASDQVVDVATSTASNRSSMAQDIARSAPTEIDSITGAIVQIATKQRIPVPVNEALLLLVKSQIATSAGGGTGTWRNNINRIPKALRIQFENIARLGGPS
jgi:2-dehydropantoate 2-reductase